MRCRSVFAATVLAAGFALLLNTAFAAGETSDRANPAIWRVTSGDSTLYLFGSLHILPPGFSWTTPQIQQAMNASEIFLFEVPVGEDSLAQERDFVLHNGILPRRQSIR